jgi:hypothetical protein
MTMTKKDETSISTMWHDCGTWRRLDVSIFRTEITVDFYSKNSLLVDCRLELESLPNVREYEFPIITDVGE